MQDQQRREMQLQQLDKMSTAMITHGVNFVKKKPGFVATYFIGILIFFFFNGWKVTQLQQERYDSLMNSIDTKELSLASRAKDNAYESYYRSKGWFTCNEACQIFKADFDEKNAVFKKLQHETDVKIGKAKSVLGIFSEQGIEETRFLFWQRFNEGNKIAQRRSFFDAIFLGVTSMGRNEKIPEYLLRVIFNVLYNFLIGVCITLVTFLFKLVGIIRSYQVSYIEGLTFFLFATLAVMSFAMTFIIGLYGATAGAVYVSLKMSKIQIENGNDERVRRIRRE